MLGTGGGGTDGTGASAFRRYDPFSSLKKFRYNGLVELVYQDYSSESSYRGHTVTGGWTTFEQIYKLGVQGYIYHPRLALFSAAIAYANDTTDSKESSDEWKSDNTSYELSLVFFPARPLSFQAYASRISTSIDSSALSTNDVTSNFYGARLLFTHKKYPMVRLEYNHWDTTIDRISGSRVIEDDFFDFDDDFDGSDEESPYVIVRKRVKDKTTIDRYSLDTTGELKFMKTRYNLSAALSDYSAPRRQYSAQYLRTNTYTTIKKQNILGTSFQYTNFDFYKLLNLSAHLTLAPINKFYHSYGYEFLTAETPDKIDSHTMSGTWRYRYSTRINSAADFRYRMAKRDNADDNSYDVNVSTNYARPIKAYDFSSSYFFSTGREERNGDFSYMNHKFIVGLATKTFRLARIYANYHITYRTLDFNPDIATGTTTGTSTDTEHVLILGAKGRGPKRISWAMELEARFLDSTASEGAWRSVYFGETLYGQKIRHYTITGDMGFPILRRGTVTLKASYTTGTTDSEAVRRYYYEGRFKYTVLRNLALTAWFREEWKNKGWWAGTLSVESVNYDYRTRDYEITCNYYWRRVLLSLEYSVTETEEGPTQSQVSRINLRASRRF